MQLIGRGTYGSVHMAVWRGSLVAVKIVPMPLSEQRLVVERMKAVQ